MKKGGVAWIEGPRGAGLANHGWTREVVGVARADSIHEFASFLLWQATGLVEAVGSASSFKAR